MLLASMSSPGAIRSSTASSGTRSMVIAASSGSTAASRRRSSRSSGEEQVRVLVAEAGRVVELAQLAPAGPARCPISSSSSRRRSSSGGSPSTSRLPAGTSSSSLAGGDAVLPHEQRVVAVDRDDDHRAGMAHDVRGRTPRRRAPATRSSVIDEEPGVARASPSRRRGTAQRQPLPVSGRHGHAGVDGLGDRSGRRGMRPSARARAACTNAANSGCGRSGRLLNSGWAWVATKNGCIVGGSSTNSTSRSSGEVPEQTQPGLLEAAPVAGCSPRSGAGGARRSPRRRRPSRTIEPGSSFAG